MICLADLRGATENVNFVHSSITRLLVDSDYINPQMDFIGTLQKSRVCEFARSLNLEY